MQPVSVLDAVQITCASCGSVYKDAGNLETYKEMPC